MVPLFSAFLFGFVTDRFAADPVCRQDDNRPGSGAELGRDYTQALLSLARWALATA